jgi:hypothetical protein
VAELRVEDHGGHDGFQRKGPLGNATPTEMAGETFPTNATRVEFQGRSFLANASVPAFPRKSFLTNAILVTFLGKRFLMNATRVEMSGKRFLRNSIVLTREAETASGALNAVVIVWRFTTEDAA